MPSGAKLKSNPTVDALSLVPSAIPDWRRGRDSNPRYGFRPYNGLANRRLQPLGHLSGRAKNLFVAIFSVKAESTVAAENAAKQGYQKKMPQRRPC